jgi:CHAT domain-containing protein/tetratricopeptide (TPR) repeat protein
MDADWCEVYVTAVLHGMLPPVPVHTLEGAHTLTELLKQEADRHSTIDARKSLNCGSAILSIGDHLNEVSIRALGNMVMGDALKLLDQREAALIRLNTARDLYDSIDDEVGRSRTCIGKLFICVHLNCVAETMQEADRAREVFERYGMMQRLLLIEMNAAIAYDLLGEYRKSLVLYEKALSIARKLDKIGDHYLGRLYINMGYAYNGLGELNHALTYYQQSRAIWHGQGDMAGIAIADMNIARVARVQGRYPDALRILYHVQTPLEERFTSHVVTAKHDLIECYLSLNRFLDARDLALQLLNNNPPLYLKALTCIQLAVAEARLSSFEKALAALDEAEPVLQALGSEGWLATLRLRRGQISLLNNDSQRAEMEARVAAEYFEQSGQRHQYAIALLLQVQIALSQSRLKEAALLCESAYAIGYSTDDPSLIYAIYLRMGEIAEQQQQLTYAIQHYQTASETVSRVQQQLILTFRPDFLVDKQDALRAILRIHLASNQPCQAFEVLEKTKAQVWLTYLNNQGHLRWLRDDPTTQHLVDQLNQLRQEHHWYYRVAHDQLFREEQHTVVSPEQAAREATARERQMRGLTEKLYLNNTRAEMAPNTEVSIDDIQSHLAPENMMVSYFSDGECLWAFTLNKHDLQVHPLPVNIKFVHEQMDKLQTNIKRALRAGVAANDRHRLHEYLRQISFRLYAALLAPLESFIRGYQQLVIVPYGVLHYLPFHLLYDGTRYLVEQVETVVLPTASLITRNHPIRTPGAVVLAHSWDGRLKHVQTEKSQVIDRLGGEAYFEDQAYQHVLHRVPRQVLHIAAHGQFRIDQPDFSYIQLADGPLYTDDLFQHDLSYELVTLSACETGKSRAVAGDELIGLGRGFLFAGAGALIASLWQVDDALTSELMRELYQHLNRGASKAEALRLAQLTLLSSAAQLHPAFWGAFELIGNPHPLSQP